jgi:multicomponent Na+:H+ antiporter subunit D
MVRQAPLLAVLFLLPALAMAGIPPLSGFVSKLGLIDAGIESRQYAIVAVSLIVSLLTVLSMIRIWAAVFWSPAEERVAATGTAAGPGIREPRRPLPMIVPTAALVAFTLAIAVAAGPIYSLSDRTARDLLDPAGYVAEVIPR